MRIKEIYCRTALVKSGLDYDYALNPYRGCGHGCVYCYAPHILKETRRWGAFVDVKRNLPNVLARELRAKRRGLVGIGTVTDAYQPLEARYEVTRRCLEQLLGHDFPIAIQTKSTLVMRDLDLLCKFTTKSVGFTITTLDDELRRKYEPSASPTKQRLDALSALELDKWVFVGPILPHITVTDWELDTLLKAIAETGVSIVYFDRLRLKGDVWPRLKAFLREWRPELVEEYHNIFFAKNDYFERLRTQIVQCAERYKLQYRLCF